MTTAEAPVKTFEQSTVQSFDLDNYILDFVEIDYFKSYFYDNLGNFTKVAFNSFLKALDIPAKFFKEQPEDTQKELIENRETFVQENKKYFGKVIVVAKTKLDGQIVNACRLGQSEARATYECLKNISEVRNRFEHRSFVKDGYITYVISNKMENNKDNQVLVVDFPIVLNKPVVIHEALYTLPNESFITPIEHIQYLNSDEVSFVEYKTIKDAISDKLGFLTEDVVDKAVKPILRENEVVSLALCHAGYLPKSYCYKFEAYLSSNIKGDLDTGKLESALLDYDETFRSYKQVTALRSIDGNAILKVLESPVFSDYLMSEEIGIEEALDL